MDTATYDGAGRETGTAQESPSGTVLTSTSATYSPDGYLTSSTNADGYTTRFAYDALGDLTLQTEPVSATTSIVTKYGYDADGNETAYTDGNGNTSYYTYNSLGLQESSTKPATATGPSDNTTTTSYTADGQVAEVQLPGGVVQNYAYDALDDLTSETGSGAGAATVCRDYLYDLDQDVVAAGCSTGPWQDWEYPTWNGLAENLGNTGEAGSSSFSYTPDGQLASRTDASGTSTFTYDSDDREATDTDALTGTTLSYAYNSLSQPATISYGSGGDVRTFGYDGEHELASDTLSYNGATIASIAYSHDDAGQVTGETTTGLANAGTQTFGYDEDGRLTSWTDTPTGGTAATTDYTYDDDGNRLTAGSTTYLYNAQDQLTSDGTSTYAYTDDGDLSSVTSDATGASVDYTSDAFGQQISDGTETGTYDAFGRAITAGSATFTYADLGNDLSSTTGGPSDGSGTTTYSRDANGQLVADGQPGDAAGASLDWTDQHGDVIGFLNDTTAGSAPTGSNAYDPWGNLISSTGHHTDLGYQGEYTDSPDGSGGTAVLMGARWYDPSAGQFQNADTASNSPTPLSVSANPYAYADDSPLDGTDPSGHGWFTDALLGALVVADAFDQEVPGLDAVTDAATAEEADAVFDAADEASSYADDDAGGYSDDSSGYSDDSSGYDDDGGDSDEGDSDDTEQEVRDEEAEREHAQEEQDARASQEQQYDEYEQEQEQYEEEQQEEEAQEERAQEERAQEEARRAEEEREAAEKRAEQEAEKRAEAQKRIDERDAKANEDVGKSVVEKGATGSDGGVGSLAAPAETVAATPDVTASVAGEAASEAAADDAAGAAADDTDATGPDDSNESCQEPTPGGQSFSASTGVLLADGKSVPISSLKVGDKVEASDTKTGKDQAETVTAVLLHADTDLYNLTVKTSHGTETIHTTTSHLFWDPSLDYAWIPANNLKPGMHLKTPDGQSAVVVGGSVPAVHDGWMWDLTVPGDNDHDFYVAVAATAVLVHNCGDGTPGYSTRTERAGDLPGKYTQGQSTRDPASQWYHEMLSNDDLLGSINNADEGEGIVVSQEGRIIGGNHRMDELLTRVGDGRIGSETPIMIQVLGDG